MNIKRFIGGSNQEVLRLVKKEMGPDAVILRTRTLPPSHPENGDRRKRVEVTAAVDYTAPDVLSQAQAGSDALSRESMMERWDALERELRDIKAAILNADARTAVPPELYHDRSIRTLYGHFRTFGLRPELVDDLLTEAHAAERPRRDATEAQLLQEALSRVLRRVSLSRPQARPGEPGEQEVYAFIGPTGVGKTTTLAKLAARRAVKEGLRTALITLDTFRIAAVSQLQTYARIMGLPVHVASGRAELDDALRRSRDAELILIDTAGRSPNREEDIEELVRLFGDRDDVHHFLVLSAATGYGNLLRAREQFGRVPFKSYIFTKLDELSEASGMLNFLATRRKPVSYFTTGQQVPEDIEAATRKRLAKLMLGMSKTAGDSLPVAANEVTKHGSSKRTEVLGRGSHGTG